MTDISDFQAGELHYQVPNFGKNTMSDQEKQWSADFGNAYTARNRVDWRARIPFWKAVIDKIGARSVSEIGCNAGWNLSAIMRACPDVQTYGVEINACAALQARAAGLKILDHYPTAELVFTAGVLIHQNKDGCKTMMDQIIDASYRYVLAIEYEAATEEEVIYRGMAGMLWRRPYGKMYEEMGLRVVQKWAAAGFDNCTAWLFEKP